MFESALADPVDFRAPWDIAFEARLTMLSRKPRRVAYFYSVPDMSTFRYRVFNMVECLNAGPDVSASWFHDGDLDRMTSVIARIETLVLCRVRHSARMARLVAAAQSRGVRVLFDIDDLVFDADYAPLVIDTLDADGDAPDTLDHYFAYCARHGAMLKLCDGTIATNAFLGAQLRRFAPSLDSVVVPNFLNRAQQALSQRIFAAKAKNGFVGTAPVQIGYFSGSPTHNRDFGVAASALAEILDRHANVQLVLVGFIEPGSALARHNDRIIRYPIQDYLNLQRLIGSVDINIAPLRDNVFTNCKSELKFFEAAIAGTLTIAAPTFAFADTIIDGRYGMLSRAHEWHARLAGALALLRDRDRLAAMAIDTHDHVAKRYGWDRQCDTIVANVLGDARSRHTGSEPCVSAPMSAVS